MGGSSSLPSQSRIQRLEEMKKVNSGGNYWRLQEKLPCSGLTRSVGREKRRDKTQGSKEKVSLWCWVHENGQNP